MVLINSILFYIKFVDNLCLNRGIVLYTHMIIKINILNIIKLKELFAGDKLLCKGGKPFMFYHYMLF